MGVMTAPLAIIKFNGIAIGKMRNISIQETLGRAPVRGLGRITPSEVPVTGWDGSFNCGLYLIDFKRAMNAIDNADPVAGAPVIQRQVNTPQEFVDYVLLEENGVTVDIIRKVKSSQDSTTGIITPTEEIFASVRGCFITREGMDISEGQIGGRNADFIYTNPIIYPQ